MAIEIKELEGGKILEVRASGKLTKEDYERFVPLTKGSLSNSTKSACCSKCTTFIGWEAGALWQDVKFDLKHFSDIERLAIVGESKWEKGMAAFCRPFPTAKIRYFDIKDIALARTWISEK